MMQSALLNSIRLGRSPHAILISGPVGSGRSTLARRAAAVHCLGVDALEALSECPNYLELNGKEIGIERVRKLVESAGLAGFNGGSRAYVILDAHRMGEPSQNALLKTLEEPPADLLIVLTGSETGLLPTIRSRVMTVRLGAKPVSAVADELRDAGVSPRDASLYAALSGGVSGRAKSLASPEGASFRNAAIDALQDALFGVPPFQTVSELIRGDKAGETAADGKKLKADPEKALLALSHWSSVLRDALLNRLHAVGTVNSDRAALIDRIASCFTEAQIQSIIGLLEQSEQRITRRANVQYTMDGCIASLLRQ